MGRETLAVSIVRHGPSGEATRATALLRTARGSPTTTQLRAARKLDALLAAELDRAAEAAAPAPSHPEADAERAEPTAPVWPLATLAANLARIPWVRTRERLRKKLDEERWLLGYRFGEPSITEPGRGSFRPIVPRAGTFWADPFPVLYRGRHWVFFEEYVRRRRRGRIVALEIGRDGSIGRPMVVLETDHHLSYPFVFRNQEELYMVPESVEAGTTVVYRCRRFPAAWDPVAEILPGQPMVDPTLVSWKNRWWLFFGQGGPADCDNLRLFHAPRPTGPWHEHPWSPVVRSPYRARPAGRVFLAEGALVRPGQNCLPRYGSQVVLHRIEELTPDTYREREVGRLRADWMPGLEGCHTLNADGGLTVVDGRLSPFWPRGPRR